MPLTLNIGKCTLLGNYRENNEDSIEVKIFPDMTLCIVADGMGGQAAGEVASKRAIEVVPREIRKNLTAGSVEEAQQVIRKAVLQANEEIITMGSLDRDLKNMGTTIVLTLWRRGPEMYVANLGDSRCYHVRGNNIEQLTVDHSLAQALVESKTIRRRGQGAPLPQPPVEIPRQQGSQGRPRRQGRSSLGRPLPAVQRRPDRPRDRRPAPGFHEAANRRAEMRRRPGAVRPGQRLARQCVLHRRRGGGELTSKDEARAPYLGDTRYLTRASVTHTSATSA